MSNELLHHPIPYSDESPGSILLRYTEYNGWKSPSILIQNLQKNINITNSKIETIICNQEKWNIVCDALNAINTSDLCYRREYKSIRAKVNFLGNSISWKALRLKKSAFCPSCLREKNYLLKLWDLRIITVCPIHKVHLIDACPKCKQNLKWNRQNVRICTCGFNLTKSPTKKANTRVAKYLINIIKEQKSEKLQNIISFFNSYKDFFDLQKEPLSEDKLVEMAVDTVSNPNFTRSIIYGYVTRGLHVDGVHPRLTLSSFISSKSKLIQKFATTHLNYIDWDNVKVERHSNLEGILKLREASKVLGLNQELTKRLIKNNTLDSFKTDRTYRWMITRDSINKLLLELHFNGKPKNSTPFKGLENLRRIRSPYLIIDKVISNEIEFYCDDFLEKGMSGIQILPIARHKEDRKHLTIKEVALLCNTYDENIRFAVHSGVIARRDKELCKGVTILIDRKVAVEFKNNYIFAGTLANNLQMNPTNFAEKLMALGLQPVSGPGIDSGLTYLFKKKEITDSVLQEVKKVESYPTKTGRKSAEEIPIFYDDIVSLEISSTLLNCSIQKTTQLMKKGYLIQIKTKNRAKYVSRESFEKIFKIENDKNLTAISDIATMFQQSVQAFSMSWIGTEFVDVIDSGLTQYLSKESINKIRKFKQKYITTREAGDLSNSHRSYLKNLKVKPACYLKNKKARIHFYDRKEIMELLKSRSNLNSPI